MAEIAICSLVRDGMEYLPSYRSQLENLILPESDSWRLYILEGDSRDRSYDFLKSWAEEDSRVTIGREHVGDTSKKEDRAIRWARAGNKCLELIPKNSTHTHVLWIEADLCFPADTLDRLLSKNVDVVAPMIYIGSEFYDTWGFRALSGEQWTNAPPYHGDFRPLSLIEMGSVGSCVLFRREILDANIRFKGSFVDGLLVGICRDARALGYRVWADTSTAILHPTSRWEAQMWRPHAIRIVSPKGNCEEVSLSEAKELCIECNIPIMDIGTFFNCQGPFLRNLFRRTETNHLKIQISAQAYPKKSYELIINVQEAAGIARFSIIRWLLFKPYDLLRRAQRFPFLEKAVPGFFSPSRFMQRLFSGPVQCQIAIVLKG